MIADAKISNFKGISLCNLDNLKPVNLFIGKNNACKSTILEAMYYTLREYAGPNLREAMTRRTNARPDVHDLWYGYDTDNPLQISLEFEAVALSIQVLLDSANQFIYSKLNAISPRTGQQYSSPQSSRYALDFSVVYGFQYGFQALSAFPGDVEELTRSFVYRCQLLDSYAKRDTNSTEELLSAIKREGKSKEFGGYLQNIYGVGESWEFLQNEFTREFHAAAIINDNPFFLSGLGDGLRYTILVLGKVLLAHDTAVFIEEIEDSQYYGSLKKLIPCLVALGKKNNVQLFITTHSYYVWDLLEKEFEDSERETRFAVFHVKRDFKNGATNCVGKTKEEADKFWSDVHQDMDEDL